MANPMAAHFFWSDGTETHLSNIFTQWDQIPFEKGFLILVLRYLDPNTMQEYTNPKLGHWIGGMDNYYVAAVGAGPNNIEYASYNAGTNRTTVYELRGQDLETSRLDVRVNTFPANRLFIGAQVSDAVFEEAVQRSLAY